MTILQIIDGILAAAGFIALIGYGISALIQAVKEHRWLSAAVCIVVIVCVVLFVGALNGLIKL